MHKIQINGVESTFGNHPKKEAQVDARRAYGIERVFAVWMENGQMCPVVLVVPPLDKSISRIPTVLLSTALEPHRDLALYYERVGAGEFKCHISYELSEALEGTVLKEVRSTDGSINVVIVEE